MNTEKLARLQASVRIGGKGTPRRKVKKAAKPTKEAEGKRLQDALTKMQVRMLPTVDEVNMFRDDGKIVHFSYPKGMCL